MMRLVHALGGTMHAGFDLGVLAILTLLISILSAWLYPRVAMWQL
jgi:hypothetical protein